MAHPDYQRNPIMLQAFTWHLPADGQHWRRVAERAHDWAQRGITTVWLPPAYKGSAGINDVGYGVYDLWDLGEFDQRGAVRTKYGTRNEYLTAIKELQKENIQVLVDLVLNHRMGGEELEHVKAREVAQDNRNYTLEEDVEVGTWSRFTFPARRPTYDNFIWDHRCFKGCDWDEEQQRNGIWLFDGKEWSWDVDPGYGNFDYLMGMDVDLLDPRVYRQLLKWGRWYLRLTGADGLRLDAVKHMSREFYQRYVGDLRMSLKRSLYVVAEYWDGDLGRLQGYLGWEENLSLFDVPLHFRFFDASNNRENFNLQTMFDYSLVQANPMHAVTFVENHDTEPYQALSSTVQAWFKPLAYALILLREAGYPCVFFADLYGLPNDRIPAVPELPLLMEIRHRFATGLQRDYFDSPEMIGWTREGDCDLEGCAVILSRDNVYREKRMEVGIKHAGEVWRCVLGEEAVVTIEYDGWVTFPPSSALLSVFMPEESAHTLRCIPIIVPPTPEPEPEPEPEEEEAKPEDEVETEPEDSSDES